MSQTVLEVFDDLGGARDHAEAYVKAEQDCLSSPQGAAAIDIQAHAIYVPPAPKVREEFEDFLVDAARVLRNLTRVASVVLGAEVPEGKGLQKRLRDLAPNNSLADLVDRYEKWIREVKDLRGEVEHHDFAIAFDVEIIDPGTKTYRIVPPQNSKWAECEGLHTGDDREARRVC